MPYTTVDAVKKAIGEERLSSLINPDADDASIEDAINAATAEMDAHLSRQYKIPLETTNLTTDQQNAIAALLKIWCNALVFFLLVPQGASGAPKGIQIAYDRAMTRLRSISDRKYKLPYLPSSVGPYFTVVGDRESPLTADLFEITRIF